MTELIEKKGTLSKVFWNKGKDGQTNAIDVYFEGDIIRYRAKFTTFKERAEKLKQITAGDFLNAVVTEWSPPNDPSKVFWFINGISEWQPSNPEILGKDTPKNEKGEEGPRIQWGALIGGAMARAGEECNGHIIADPAYTVTDEMRDMLTLKWGVIAYRYQMNPQLIIDAYNKEKPLASEPETEYTPEPPMPGEPTRKFTSGPDISEGDDPIPF